MSSTPDGPTSREFTPGLLLLVALVWVVALASVVFGIAALISAQPGRDDAPALTRAGRELRPNNENTRPVGDVMTIANRPDASLTVLSAGFLPFHAASYGRVIIDADPLPENVEVALIWLRRDEPGVPREQRIAVRRGQLVATTLDGNPDWRGEIAFVAIGVKGAMAHPWSLRTLRLEQLGIAGVVADIVGAWTHFERWDGRSINIVFGGRDDQRAWLPPLAFVASALSALVVWGLARRRGKPASAAALLMPFLVGWLVVDLRWQANLFEQARETFAQFGGKSWEERHAAMEDGDLFRFVHTAAARLPADPVRIFVNSDFEYFRRRAGYHLYPHNVLAYNWAEPSQLRPGEYLLLYQKADVRFDTGTRELLWTNGRRLDAIPIVVQRGAGLFMVGPKGGR